MNPSYSNLNNPHTVNAVFNENQNNNVINNNQNSIVENKEDKIGKRCNIFIIK
jgi:hypothetical protein